MNDLPATSQTLHVVRFHLSGDTSTVPTLLPPAPHPFVGRAREMQLLRDRMLAGPRLIFLTGPGGIGKTGLALAAARHMAGLGYFSDGVLWVDGREVPSFGGVLDSLAEQLGQYGAAGRPLEMRARLVIQQMADHDYLLVLDNMDALAEGRRQTVQFLRQLPGAALVTVRLHPPGLDTPERLQPLSLAGTYSLLQSLTGQSLPQDDAQRLLRQVEGAPLATLMIAARVRDGLSAAQLTPQIARAQTGQLRSGSLQGQTPAIYRNLTVALNGINDSQTELLLAASCLPRSFAAPLIAYVVGRDSTDEVTRELSVLHERGLLERIGAGWRVHDALIEGLSGLVGERATNWHWRAAELLRQGSLADTLPAAEHLFRAGDFQQAATLLIGAREQLIGSGLESQLAEQLATFSPAPLGRELWGQLSEAQGDVATKLGQYWEADRFYERSLQQLSPANPTYEERLIATRRLRKRAEAALAQKGGADEAKRLDRAEQWLKHAANVATTSNPDELIRLPLLLSILQERRGNLDGALLAAQQALGLARRFSLTSFLSGCYRRTADLRRLMGDGTSALVGYDSALALLGEKESSRERARLLNALAQVHHDLGNWVEAVEAFEDSIPLWQEANQGESLAHTFFHLGRLLMYQGRYSEAQRYLQEANIIARRRSLNALRVMVQSVLAEGLLHQGEVQVVAAMVQQNLEEAQRSLMTEPLPALFRLQSELSQRAGRVEEAVELRQVALIWAQRNNDPVERYRIQIAMALADDDLISLDMLADSPPVPLARLDGAILQLKLVERYLSDKPDRARVLVERAADTMFRLGYRPELTRLDYLRKILSV